MRELRGAAAQFEARDGDKSYNLDVIRSLARKARESGAELVSFHECSIPGHTFPENVRITAMLGADIVLMPHVTGCLPSPMPGRGTVAPEIWHNRERDPVRCRQEFDGPKGRAWLMRWLPTRCWENGIFAIYSNPI